MAAQLRSTDGLVMPAVASTLLNLDLGPADLAASRLALVYARAIDDAQDPKVLAELGPKLLAALVELGATPKARAVKGGAPAGGKGKLQSLRDSRTA